MLSESRLSPRMVRDAIRLADLDVAEEVGELPAVIAMKTQEKVRLAMQLERGGDARAGMSVMRTALSTADEPELHELATRTLERWLVRHAPSVNAPHGGEPRA